MYTCARVLLMAVGERKKPPPAKNKKRDSPTQPLCRHTE